MNETPYHSVNDRRLIDLRQWLKENNFPDDQLTVASADAGFRRYFRIRRDQTTLIAVDAPPETEDNAAFLNIAERLSDSGVRVPEVYCYSLEKGFMVIEDLGLFHLQHTIEKKRCTADATARLYHQAMQTLITMQQQTPTDGLALYNQPFLDTELEIFSTWYVQKHLQYNISASQKSIIQNAFSVLTDNASQQPAAFVHRDFHCRNLMVPDNDIYVIDFQGALKGPITYDCVSLIKDVYFELPESLQESLIEQHRTALHPGIDRCTYQQWFDLMGLQRQLKILGIFCRLNYRDGKAHYLQHLQRVRQLVTKTLSSYPELSAFSDLFTNLHNENTP